MYLIPFSFAYSIAYESCGAEITILSQASNAAAPILVTPPGIVILGRLSHQKKHIVQYS